MKLGFFFRNKAVYWLAALVRTLETNYDVSANSGAIANAWTLDVLRQDFAGRCDGFHYLLEFLQRNWSTFDISAPNLERLEAMYGGPNLWLDLMSDRYLSSRPYHDALRMIVGHLTFWERYYDTTGVEAFLMEANDMLSTLTAYRVAMQRGIDCLTWVSLPTNPQRVGFAHNLYYKPDSVTRCFHRLQESQLSIEQHQRADEHVNAFRAQAARPIWNEEHLRAPNRPTVRASNLRSFACRLPAYYLRNGKLDYTDQGPFADAIDRLKFVLRARRLHSSDLFDRPSRDDRFVYFPLHFQPEATTLVCAPFHVDQLNLIEQLARSLPVNMLLYVKEHPVSLGRRPISYYQRIKKLSNVRLINASVDSHELIRQAAATITITGTAGWEALLYERPVIYFGNAFWDIFPLAKRVTDIAQLPYVFRDWLPTYQPDYELLLKLVTALFQGSYPIEGGSQPDDPDMPDDERIDGVARAIAAELNLQPRGRTISASGLHSH
ncbi:MAG: hypothetical protein EPO21_19995 [Chloroflexota bacterium]|nr:MAG: hypothetical protein EPO21_19995 [Chloroflexota bacterium]